MGYGGLELKSLFGLELKSLLFMINYARKCTFLTQICKVLTNTRSFRNVFDSNFQSFDKYKVIS